MDAGKKKIWVRGQFVEVTDEVYTAYMRGDRKMRYFEADLSAVGFWRMMGKAQGKGKSLSNKKIPQSP